MDPDAIDGENSTITPTMMSSDMATTTTMITTTLPPNDTTTLTTIETTTLTTISDTTTTTTTMASTEMPITSTISNMNMTTKSGTKNINITAILSPSSTSSNASNSSSLSKPIIPSALSFHGTNESMASGPAHMSLINDSTTMASTMASTLTTSSSANGITTMNMMNSNLTTTTQWSANKNGTSIDDNYDDGFGPDYKDLLQLEMAKEKIASEATWSSVLLGAAVSNILILLFLLAITRGKAGYFGIRLYTLNLALFSALQIALIAWMAPEDIYGMHKFLCFGLQDFMDKYTGSLLECTQLVYLSASTVLMFDCIQRYRNNGLGISKCSWIFGIIFIDLLPMVYIFVKGIHFEYVQIRPKPMAIYHVVVLALFVIVKTLLGLAIICLPFYRCCGRKQEEIVINGDPNQRHAIKQKMWTQSQNSTNSSSDSTPPKPFVYAKLLLLFLFIMATGWPQFTVFNLGVDLQTGEGGMQQQASKMKEEIQQQPNSTVAMMVGLVREARVVYWLMSIQKWAAIGRPFLETFFAIFLLLIPSIGSKLKVRKICPNAAGGTNGIASSADSRGIANGGHRNNTAAASGTFAQQAEISMSQIHLPQTTATAPPMSTVNSWH